MSKERMRFQSALVDGQWIDDVTLTIENGVVVAIDHDEKQVAMRDQVALPGMINLHSHAFQRGFAGLSEYRTAEQDSFWTWRDLMYKFVLRLCPQDVYVIAKHLYLEMLRAGYVWVGEFHYLHKDHDGSRYGNLGEMSQAIARAARDSGIGLCHLPVLYQQGGFECEPLTAGQKRFELSTEQFVELVNDCQAAANDQWNATCGMALHSLRAVDAKVGREVVSQLQQQYPEMPIHIHVAEQVKEVADCESVFGRRSVEYLYDQYEVNERWCLIHATHLTDAEVAMIAKSKAVVGLCPATEANLGDGFFRAPEFLKQGGRIGVGSDSHCAIDFRDELRTLEYGQRLQQKSRAILGSDSESVGRNLYRQCVRGGAQAIAMNSGKIAVGYRADLTLIDPSHASIALAKHDRLLDRLVFTNAGNPVAGVVVGGRQILTQSTGFRTALRESSVEFNRICQSLSEQS